jgi:hypothetical protein
VVAFLDVWEFVEQEVVFVRDPATDEMARVVTSRAGMVDVEVGFFYDPAEARRWACGRG